MVVPHGRGSIRGEGRACRGRPLPGKHRLLIKTARCGDPCVSTSHNTCLFAFVFANNCICEKTRPLTHFDIAMDSIGEALYKAMSSEHHAAEVDWTMVDPCVLWMCQLLVMGKVNVTMKQKGQPVEQDVTLYESTILSLVQLMLGTVSCCTACVHGAASLWQCHWHCFSLFDLPEDFTRMDKLCDCLKMLIQASLFKGLPASLSFKWLGLRDLERLGEEAHVVAQPSAKDLAKAAKLQAKEEQRAAKRQEMERLRDAKKTESRSDSGR